MSSKRLANSQARLSRSDWLAAARNILIASGIDAVKVDRVAKSLNVTRGGFYWHFKDRQDLHEALLDGWERETNRMFEATLSGGDYEDGVAEFQALVDAWIEEDTYSPAYDAAMRDWARTSKHAATAVRRVDKHRIAIITRIFEDLGFSGTEAFIRARITYFHQVGYYALGLGESPKERKKLLPYYLYALTGGKIGPDFE